MQIAYHNKRRLLTLQGSLALTVPIRVCRNADCRAHKKAGASLGRGSARAARRVNAALISSPLSATAATPSTRALCRSIRRLREREVNLCERSVCNLLHRYEELVALHVASSFPQLKSQGRVMLAIDGLQPDKGHEVLWVLRDCLSGTILLARSLLSAAQEDLAALLREVKEALPVPICGVISDGQNSLRPAVAAVLPHVPHQLCQFHYLREAARPVYEADRHAKKELKKRVRGIRPLEHTLAERDDDRGAGGARLLSGGTQCAHRRWATASGGARTALAGTVHRHYHLAERRREKGGLPEPLLRLKTILEKALSETRDDWDAIRTAIPGFTTPRTF